MEILDIEAVRAQEAAALAPSTASATPKKSKPKPTPSGNVYKLRFHGEYYVEGGIKGTKARYEFDDILMTDHEREMGFLHTFVRYILTDPEFITYVARKKYPNWKRRCTAFEDGVLIRQPDGSFVPVREFGLMNRQQLTAFISHEGLDIDVDLYPTAPELRQAIQDYRDNSAAFLQYQAKRKLHQGAKLLAQKNIRGLNSWAAPMTPDATPPALAEDCVPEDFAKQDRIKKFLDDV